MRVWGESDRKLDARRPDELAALARDSARASTSRSCASVEEQVAPSDPLVLIYSSGSTADPKGASTATASIIRHSFNLNSFRDLDENDRVFSPMPFFWVGGFTFTLLSAMHAVRTDLCEEPSSRARRSSCSSASA